VRFAKHDHVVETFAKRDANPVRLAHSSETFHSMISQACSVPQTRPKIIEIAISIELFRSVYLLLIAHSPWIL
jgi:hypothetical protein